MKQLLLILIMLTIALLAYVPAAAQDTAPQPVTACLELNGYQGYTIHAPLVLFTGQTPYQVRPNDSVVQRIGASQGFTADNTLPTLQGTDIWQGYGHILYADSWQVAVLELRVRGLNKYLEIRRDTEHWFAFPYNDLLWFAVDNGTRVYTHSAIIALYQREPAAWASHHWGWHPCGAYEINPEQLPPELVTQ